MPSGGATRGDQGGIVVVFLLLLFATFLFSANSSSGQRSAAAGVITLLLFPLVWFVPRAGLPAMVTFLMTMGGLRRSLIPLLGYSEADPIILISPIVATICFVNLLINRRLRPTSQLGKWATILMCLMGLAVLNPLQGNPLVGLTGAAFYLVPLMWYCIGKNVGTPQITTKLIQVILLVSVLSAVAGLKQYFFGFSDAELEWFKVANFSNAVGSTERPVSFFTSPSEYASFLSIGFVICFCNFLRGQKNYLVIALFLIYALFLTGIRGGIVASAGASILVWAVQGKKVRDWIPRIAVALAVIVVGGFLGLQKVGSATEGLSGTDAGNMISHQVEGLTDPLKKGASIHGHLENIQIAFISGIKMPVGYGLGASTIGSIRFGGSSSFNAETDIATLFYCLGAIGGVVFLRVIVVTFRAAGQYWYYTRSYAPLVTIGVLAASNGSWLTPGHYAQSVAVWLLIGCLDNSWKDGRIIPGLTEKMKQSKSPLSIWRRNLIRRLRGTDSAWEASYQRAGQNALPRQTR
jgi:hypothetical protein